MKSMFKKVFNVWVLIVLFIYDLWIMFPLIGNVLSVENNFDHTVPNAYPYILFSFINILFLICYSCIRKRSQLLFIYSLAVIVSVLAKDFLMAGLNWPITSIIYFMVIIYYMINAPFAGLALLLQTPKQFSIALCIICVLLIYINAGELLKKHKKEKSES